MRVEYELKFRDVWAFYFVDYFLLAPIQSLFGGIAIFAFYVAYTSLSNPCNSAIATTIVASAIIAVLAYIAVLVGALFSSVFYVRFSADNLPALTKYRRPPVLSSMGI
ncbi:MAG: hypothetical protein LBB65_06915 [Burkholderiales bacterium]|jgi:hypothetical protein|nr:hypothetical protein [Burkholderiales bacterium]